MKRSSGSEKGFRQKAALLWDESFLWGLMSYKALCENHLSFDLIRSSDIGAGRLTDYSMLFVPGGWASNKIKSLGEEGVSEIRKFVEKGGSYLGFCGGAGLATLDGIGLLKIKRKPTSERVPSFSGRIRVKTSDHPIWKSLSDNAKCKVQNAKCKSGEGSRNNTSHDEQSSSLFTLLSSPVFHAWWPSQFIIDGAGIDVLASYDEALPDSFSSDLNVGDTSSNGDWAELEKLYSMNLNPGRLYNDPAVVEGRCGRGRVVLSLLHFDTPGDRNGQTVLQNLWQYLGGEMRRNAMDYEKEEPAGRADEELLQAVSDLEETVERLISLGRRNFLWFWRNPILLQWRRGVRGLEYCTLYIMVKEITGITRTGTVSSDTGERLNRIRALLTPFVEEAMRLLVMERLAMQNGRITYEKCDDPELKKIRTALFSNSKSHGGMFKEVVDEIDGLLFSLLKEGN